MKFHWWYYLLYVGMLPHTLIGLLFAVCGGSSSWRWSQGCIEVLVKRIIGNPNAQTWGFLILYDDKFSRGDQTSLPTITTKTKRQYRNWWRKSCDLRVHERCHVFQGIMLGPLFPILYGATFLYHWARSGFGPWYPAYLQVPFEEHAYQVQREYRDGHLPNAWGDKAFRPDLVTGAK